MGRDAHLTIVNPLREQEPFHHVDERAGGEIGLHWDGVGPSHGASKAWVSLIELHPGKGTTLHAHPHNEEFFVVVRGIGSVREGTAASTRERQLEPFDIVMAPPDVAKQVTNSGDEPLTLVQVYAPPPDHERIADVANSDTFTTHVTEPSKEK